MLPRDEEVSEAAEVAASVEAFCDRELSRFSAVAPTAPASPP